MIPLASEPGAATVRALPQAPQLYQSLRTESKPSGMPRCRAKEKEKITYGKIRLRYNGKS
jgi:hypothetical protein